MNKTKINNSSIYGELTTKNKWLETTFYDLMIFNVNPYDLDSEHTQHFKNLADNYHKACKDSKCYILGGLVENAIK